MIMVSGMKIARSSYKLFLLQLKVLLQVVSKAILMLSINNQSNKQINEKDLC